jgi:hypothetical protein
MNSSAIKSQLPRTPFIRRNPARARRTLEIRNGTGWGVNPVPGWNGVLFSSLCRGELSPISGRSQWYRVHAGILVFRTNHAHIPITFIGSWYLWFSERLSGPFASPYSCDSGASKVQLPDEPWQSVAGRLHRRRMTPPGSAQAHSQSP